MPDKNQKESLKIFKDYYEANAPALVVFARRFVSTEMAEDIVHDMFLEVWNHLDNYNGMPPSSYLFMGVRNRCLNVLRRKQLQATYIQTAQLENRILGLDYYNSPDKFIAEKDDLQVIYNQIEQLPEKCRVIFKMAYFEEKKNAEIADALGISVRTVEHQLYLGMKTLRERLNKKQIKSLFFMLFF